MDITVKPDLRLVVGGPPIEALLDYSWGESSDPYGEGEYAWDEPVWLCPFIPGQSLPENCYAMARPLFGKPRAEWAMALAHDLIARRPETDQGKQKRSWSAAILLAAAADHGLRADARRWEEVMHDVTELSGVRRETAVRRLTQLVREGLPRPVNPPAYWRDIEPITRIEDYLDPGDQ